MSDQQETIDRAWHAFTVLRGKKEDIVLLSGLIPTEYADRADAAHDIFLSKANVHINIHGVVFDRSQRYTKTLDFSMDSMEKFRQCATSILWYSLTWDWLADTLEQAVKDLNHLEQVLYQNLYKKLKKFNPEAFAAPVQLKLKDKPRKKGNPKADKHNPNNPAYKAAQDNRANQKNPNNAKSKGK